MSVSAEGLPRPDVPAAVGHSADSAFEGVRVVGQAYPFGAGRFYPATDAAGRRYRLIEMPLGAGLPPLTPDRIAALRDIPGIVRPLAHTRLAGGEFWITEWPEGADLLSVMARGELDVEGRRTIAVRLCHLVEALQSLKGVDHGAINPASIFIDSSGVVRLDGVGFDELIAGYQRQRLSTLGRERTDYAPRGHNFDGDSERAAALDVHGLGMVLFELFSGGLPRGSFFPMPSEKCSLDSRLDTALLTAVGMGRPGEQVSAGKLCSVVQAVGYVARGTGQMVSAPVRYDDDEPFVPQRKRSQIDGMFSWMPNWIAVVAVAAGLLGAAAVTFVHKEQRKAEEMALLDIDPAMRMLDEAEQLFALEKRLEALQKIALVAEGAPISAEVLARMAGILIRANEYDAFLEQGGIYRMRAWQEGGADAEKLLAVFKKFEGEIGDYNKAMNIAELVASRGDQFAQNAALRTALDVFADDRDAAKQLASNPIEIRAAARAALQRLRAENPDIESLRWRMVARQVGMELDLAGNAGLRSIAALEGQPMVDLDLSGTSVRELWSLETAPLRSLRVDRTEVRSLGPVVATPIRDLSFARSQVRAVPFLDTHPTLMRYRGHCAGRLKLKASSPSAGMGWVNSLGQRLLPLPTSGGWFAKREVRVGDYRAFVESSGHRGGADALPPRQRGWADDPVALEREEFAMAGVSRVDAEAFCQWLTDLERGRGTLTSAQRYRLPTDEEWSAAAGLNASPYQDVRSRAREAFGRPLPEVDRFEVIDAEGDFEPAGYFPLKSVSESNLASVSKPSGVGSFHSDRAFNDLATGVREWLHGDWAAGDQRCPVRGMSWRLWASAAKDGGVGDPLVRREAVDPGERADDLGFRVVLEDLESMRPPALVQMVTEGRLAEVKSAVQDMMVVGASPELRRVASSLLAATRGSAGKESFGDGRYAAVALPLSLSAARSFCEAVGGELAVPRDHAEREWLRTNFMQPSNCASVWVGEGAGGAGRVAIPWPFEEVDVSANEQHAFVVRWNESEAPPQ